MKRILAVCLGLLLGVPDARAITVSLYSSLGSGISSVQWNVIGADVLIYETWTRDAPAFLIFTGLYPGADYWIHIWAYNHTPNPWSRMANELLDPYEGPGSVDDGDVRPYPPWVPLGFSTTNPAEGLEISPQGVVYPYSNPLHSWVMSTYAERRQYIDFYGGTVDADSGLCVMRFGVYDAFPAYNEPFLLAQRPNAYSSPPVPEPATLLLAGLGVAVAAARRSRGRRQAARG
ncbi:MAG TPA: PEP-CTERM sorting domain-containing protein [Candidatus Saccharimonadales bacterium]|nr:PEP-CTERM sorting domain-containing protein [Candidatus Saccharimonadales bacterium]